LAFTNPKRLAPGPPDHWDRLPLVMWTRTDSVKRPISDVRITSVRLGSKNPRKQEMRLFKKGYLKLPEDLHMMGCDGGTYVWIKYRDDTKKEEEDIVKRIARLQNLSHRPSVTTKRILTEHTDGTTTTSATATTTPSSIKENNAEDDDGAEDEKEKGKEQKEEEGLAKKAAEGNDDEEEEEEQKEVPLTASSVRLWAMVNELALDDIEVAAFKALYDSVDRFGNGYIDLEDMVAYAGFTVGDFPMMLRYFVAMACPQCEDNLGRPFHLSVPGEGGFFAQRSTLRRLTDPIRFGDFVRLLGVFCLMDTKHFVRMTFNFGDRERNGSILRDDVFRILFAMWPPACSGDRLTLKLAIEKYMKTFNVGTR
jgi:hypothetical protein